MRLGSLKFWPRNSFGSVLFALCLIFLGFFLLWPVSLIVGRAFTGDSGFTLEHFVVVFSNESQLLAIANSLKIAFATCFFSSLFSLPLAFVSARLNFVGKRFLTALLLVPMIMPPFVGAIGIQRFFALYGSVNMYLLDHLWISEPIEWLSGDSMLFAVVVLEVLHLYPIMYLNFSAAIANIDPSLEEAATSLGCSWWTKMSRIIWPLIRPGFFSGGIVVFVWALTDLGAPLLVGFQETLPVHIFNMVTSASVNPVGYALVVLVIIMTVVLFLVSKYFSERSNLQMLCRGHAADLSQNLGVIGHSLVYLGLGGVILLALSPHISVLITSLSDSWFMTPFPEKFTGKYFSMIFSQDLPLIGIGNSFWYSGLSTIFDLVFGFAIAYVISRRLVAFSWFLDALVMLPLALPGIVLAFGYVVAYTGTFLDPLQNPGPLLVIAYGIRRLPYMVRAVSAGLAQTSRSLEEASQVLGASHFKTLTKITVPLVSANLIAGGLLCFSYAMLDVSDSLMLAMKDQFYPLTKAIYALYLEQGSGEFVASALGVVSMGIMAICILLAASILGKKMGELFRT